MINQEPDFQYTFQPATSPTDTRTILALHGTGGDENDLIPLAQAVFPGAAILSPRGKVLEGSAPRFFRRLAEGVLDLEDLAFRTEELANFVARSAVHHGFDAGNVVAIGFSNGANIAVSMLMTRPGVLRGAVLLSPMLPFVPEEAVDLTGTTVFIGAGNMDPLVPATQIQQLTELLTGAGASVTLHLEDVGHTITDREVRAAQQWALLLT